MWLCVLIDSGKQMLTPMQGGRHALVMKRVRESRWLVIAWRAAGGEKEKWDRCISKRIVITEGDSTDQRNLFDEMQTDRKNRQRSHRFRLRRALYTTIEAGALLRSGGEDRVLQRFPVDATHEIHDDDGFESGEGANLRGKMIREMLRPHQSCPDIGRLFGIKRREQD